MRKLIIRNLPLIIPSLAFIGIFLLYANYLKQHSPNRDDNKLKELERISSSISIFPAFGNETTQTSSAADDAGIYKYYHSSANFDEVKKFYITQLSQKDWSLADSDAKGEITFRKGEFLIGIHYTGNNSKSNKWNYSVSFVWRDY